MGILQARKNTGVGFCALLQGIFPTQESNPCLTFPALAGGCFTLMPPGKPRCYLKRGNKHIQLKEPMVLFTRKVLNVDFLFMKCMCKNEGIYKKPILHNIFWFSISNYICFLRTRWVTYLLLCYCILYRFMYICLPL